MGRRSKSEEIINLREAIKDTALKQLFKSGVHAISLRSIARSLNITAPAIYNYFTDREALLKALSIDAYTSLGDYQFKAQDDFLSDQIKERFFAIGSAYREWAKTYPELYNLLFGPSLRGADLPMIDMLSYKAGWFHGLVSVIDDHRVAGKLRIESVPLVTLTDEEKFLAWKTSARSNFYMVSFAVAMIIWSRLHGIVSLEIGSKIPPFRENGAALYIFEVERIYRQFIKE